MKRFEIKIKKFARFNLLIAISVLEVYVTQADTQVVGGTTWNYTVSGDNASVGDYWNSRKTAVGRSTSGSITVPSWLGGHRVTAIGYSAFCSCGNITAVQIPSSVLEIQSCAFKDCGRLANVVIPSSVTKIGGSSFWGCNRLGSVNIPYGVTEIETCTFMMCSNLVSVTIPSSVTSLEYQAFGNCSMLSSVQLPTSVTQIGIAAFGECIGLSSIIIPSSVSSIANSAFSGCSGMMSIEVDPDNANFKSENGLLLTKDGKMVIGGINGDVIIPDGVTNIAESAFQSRRNLTSVSIPMSVRDIGLFAFMGCVGLTSMTIPDTVTKIGSRAFKDCSRIQRIDFEGAPPQGLSSACIEYDVCLRYNCEFASEWSRTLAQCYFSNAIPYTPPLHTQSVDNVEWSFRVTNGISEVVSLPKTTSGAVQIPSLLGGHSVKRIGEGCFRDCNSISSVVIPQSVEIIAASAFEGCTGLVRVEINDLAKWCGVAFGNATANPLYCGHHLYLNGSEISALNVPTNVSAIRDYAFYNASAISAVTIPASVTSIGANAFTGCTGIRTIDIPASYNVATVFPSAYSAITQLTIPDGTTTIAANAYQGCSGVTAVVVPASVTTVGSGAFQDCGSLKSVMFKGQAPACGDNVFTGTSADMVVYAGTGTSGWTQWNGRPLAFVDPGSGSGSGSETVAKVQLTVTNVVIHYVINSVMPETATPMSEDTGFVNIITEVKSGGAVSVPSDWKTNYTSFVTKFGDDFAKSLMKPTGKRDGAGNSMCVWQDYVAGTDPTDENDKFTASVTMVDGKPVISYTPELNASETALRTYKTWGKIKLQDTDWVEVSSGHESDYNFFKVTVEMK